MNKYITFTNLGHPKGKKMDVWRIFSNSNGDILGHLKFYGAWRQYCFYPEPGTIWNEDCLQAIRVRCVYLTTKWRKGQ